MVPSYKRLINSHAAVTNERWRTHIVRLLQKQSRRVISDRLFINTLEEQAPSLSQSRRLLTVWLQIQMHRPTQHKSRLQQLFAVLVSTLTTNKLYLVIILEMHR